MGCLLPGGRGRAHRARTPCPLAIELCIGPPIRDPRRRTCTTASLSLYAVALPLAFVLLHVLPFVHIVVVIERLFSQVLGEFALLIHRKVLLFSDHVDHEFFGACLPDFRLGLDSFLPLFEDFTWHVGCAAVVACSPCQRMAVVLVHACVFERHGEAAKDLLACLGSGFLLGIVEHHALWRHMRSFGFLCLGDGRSRGLGAEALNGADYLALLVDHNMLGAIVDFPCLRIDGGLFHFLAGVRPLITAGNALRSAWDSATLAPIVCGMDNQLLLLVVYSWKKIVALNGNALPFRSLYTVTVTVSGSVRLVPFTLGGSE